MRKMVRAIVVKDHSLLLMKRSKLGQEFYSLVGGGIDDGETAEQALHREVMEESSITIANPRLVIYLEDTQFGEQAIYTSDYLNGEPELASDSFEAADTEKGKNTYQPLWLPVNELDKIDLLPLELKSVLQSGLKNGWPAEPIRLTIAG